MNKKLDWRFSSAVSSSKAMLSGNHSLESQDSVFRAQISDASTPVQFVCELPSLTVGVTRQNEAVVEAQACVTSAWKKVHLVWRYDALNWKVKLDRLTEMCRNNPQKARNRQMRIALVDAQSLNAILMTAGMAAVLREDQAAAWLGDRCRKMISQNEFIMNTGAWTTGCVEPFLLKLFCLWRQQRFPDQSHAELGIFQSVFDAWESPKELELAVSRILDLHVEKVVNYDLPDDDFVFGLQVGLNFNMPVEMMFLQRVREDLGLSIPRPNHAFLESPLGKTPNPIPRSETDEYLVQTFGVCRTKMPDLEVPWESGL